MANRKTFTFTDAATGPESPSLQFLEVEKSEESASTDTSPSTQEASISSLHDGQIRDILRRPELFFSTAAAFEEAIVLLIAMRRNFKQKFDIIPFRTYWLERELSWCPQAASLHQTMKEGGLEDIELHRYLLSRLVRDFDSSLFAERETFASK